MKIINNSNDNMQQPQGDVMALTFCVYDARSVFYYILGAFLLSLCLLMMFANGTMNTVQKVSTVKEEKPIDLTREQKIKVEPEVIKMIDNYDPVVNSELYKLARYNEFVIGSIEKMYTTPYDRRLFEIFTLPIDDVKKYGTIEKREQHYRYHTGRTKAVVNVRSDASVESSILCTLLWNTHLEFRKYNSEWKKVVLNNGTVGYINTQYVTRKEATNKVLGTVREHQKSYMDYRTVTARGTKAYHVSRTLAYTGAYGIRQIDGRFLCAVGTYYASENEVGKYVDLILANGTVIPCILGDTKANKDTDSSNMYTRHDHSVVEFIVDTGSLSSKVRRQGNLNYANSNWNSSIVDIRVYDKSL